MDDLISRQAASDEIDEWIKAFRENGHKESAADACLIKDGIIQLPSAQPNKEQKKTGEWEMFELITSVYYGKQYYFKQENGIVYSRSSHKYMLVDDAIQEYLDVIGE